MPLAGERTNPVFPCVVKGGLQSAVGYSRVTLKFLLEQEKKAAGPQVRLGRGCRAVTRGLVLGWVGGGWAGAEDLMDEGRR